jgi:hypothetical protein
MNTHNRPADIAATLVLLIVHGALFGATIVLLGLFVMITDPWGDVKCGDPAWIDRAMRLGIWGGAAVLLADVVVAVYLLARHRWLFSCRSSAAWRRWRWASVPRSHWPAPFTD